jgi:outer membrane protein TolC
MTVPATGLAGGSFWGSLMVVGAVCTTLAAQALAQTPGSPPDAVVSQAAPRAPLTLDAALSFAAEHYPTVRAALEDLNSSVAGRDVAKSAYLPRLDSVWQSNRGTVNNITGPLLPQSVLPGISGPPLAGTSGQSVWGSAAGVLLSWEPFDFGLRSAAVGEAEAAIMRARAGQALTRLEVQQAVGVAFLGVVAATQAETAAAADVARREILARAARALADAQLRPGAEAARADAEHAAALTRAILARQTRTIAEATLWRVLGATTDPGTVNADTLLARLPLPDAAPATTTEHPLLQVRQAAVDLARAQESVIASTYRPRLFVQASGSARGSGAEFNGALESGADGLSLERANWAAGVQVVFPNLFDFASAKARQRASAAATRAESARLDEGRLVLTAEQRTADALVQAARDVAQNTPVQLAAARQSETQARARYDAGLASIVEVAEAQGLLAAAEVQDAVARVDVWRALLGRAAARDAIEDFVTLVRGKE